jgi:hypothetical protein
MFKRCQQRKKMDYFVRIFRLESLQPNIHPILTLRSKEVLASIRLDLNTKIARGNFIINSDRKTILAKVDNTQGRTIILDGEGRRC